MQPHNRAASGSWRIRGRGTKLIICRGRCVRVTVPPSSRAMGKDWRRIFSLKRRRRLPPWVYWLLAQLVRLLRLTYRTRVVDPHDFLGRREPWPVIFVLWHNRILFLADCFPKHARRRAAALISGSRDGEYAAAFIRRFGLDVVRGSSSRGGHRALRELKRKLDAGVSTVIALDGPRGPRYAVHPGAAMLARLSGRPIVPLSLNAQRRWELHGWDRTQIPKPFARVEFRIGPPLVLERSTRPGDRDEAVARVGETLMDITDDARP